jgi:porin
LADGNQNIPAVSGLIWSPIFVNASMIGAMMGFYNPGNGVTINFTPSKSFYVNLGVYDGNRARGIQTGVNPPLFNGYYFNIAEVGIDWLLGEGGHPGQFGIGLWRQTGLLSVQGITEDGTGGFYLFGSPIASTQGCPTRRFPSSINSARTLRRRCRCRNTTASAPPHSA